MHQFILSFLYTLLSCAIDIENRSQHTFADGTRAKNNTAATQQHQCYFFWLGIFNDDDDADDDGNIEDNEYIRFLSGLGFSLFCLLLFAIVVSTLFWPNKSL